MVIRRASLAFCMAAISATAIGPNAASGQSSEAKSIQSVAEMRSDKNWMYEYVNLRVYAANAQVGNIGLPVSRIVGGRRADATDNPFQVALLNKDIANNFNAQFCGGSLISPTIIVTAAHCSDFVNSSQVQVLTGARSLDGTGTRRDVQAIVVHPKWNSSNQDYDVAVWRLSSPAAGPFATLAATDGTGNMLATGWGALTEGGSFPVELHRVELPLVDRGDCNDANSYNGSITARMMCAGTSGGGRDTCQGDSGGPLTRNNELVGITSWGRGCARPNFYGVYARVSDTEIKSFIEAND